MKNLTWQDLRETSGWATFAFDDGSEIIFQTTLNQELLDALCGEKPRQDELFDIDKGIWRKVPPAMDFQLYLTDERPEQDEVNKFASLFV